MSTPSFSVLLSVYRKENPEFMSRALRSIWDDQTVRPSEIVLVKDGPLTEELETVITEFARRAPLKIIAFEQNRGLGEALRMGLKVCSYEWVARMDTDDISKPERFEKQLALVKKRPDLDVVGSWVDEFIGTTNNVVSQKTLPELPEQLFQYGKRRCPLNHPSVMFRKKAVEDAGSYQHFLLFEDYWLWVRMMAAGCRFYNIQEALLWFRTSPDVYKRRSGWSYAYREVTFQRALYCMKYINFRDFLINVSIRFPMRIMPNFMRAYIYRHTLRSKKIVTAVMDGSM